MAAAPIGCTTVVVVNCFLFTLPICEAVARVKRQLASR